jgi:hypothetical protein
MDNLSFTMVFLGAITKTGKKSGKDYTVAKFVDTKTNDVYEFFVRDEVMEDVKKLVQFVPAVVLLSLSAFQGEAKVNFVGIGQ